MPNTVKAKLLLGWMKQHEAVKALNACVFEEPLTKKKAVTLWSQYRDKVAALAPRNPGPYTELPLTEFEQKAVQDHTQRVSKGAQAAYLRRVIKIHPGDLVARQFHVLSDHSNNYGQQMCNEATRINNFLGVGLEFKGQLVMRQLSPRVTCIDLPHAEYVVFPRPGGFEFRERDRYVLVVPAGNKLVLWGGYHRTHAVLCHMAGDAAGTAPLLTVMEGIPEVENFFARTSTTRDTVLGERPALLRDFLDEDLFINVNLRKTRAEARIEQVRPGKLRAQVRLVPDDRQSGPRPKHLWN